MHAMAFCLLAPSTPRNSRTCGLHRFPCYVSPVVFIFGEIRADLICVPTRRHALASSRYCNVGLRWQICINSSHMEEVQTRNGFRNSSLIMFVYLFFTTIFWIFLLQFGLIKQRLGPETVLIKQNDGWCQQRFDL